jgi:membrane-associated phospholipid phosphatase
MWARLRSSEWTLIAFFLYVATVSLFFPLTALLRFSAFAVAALVAVACAGLAALERHAHPRVLSMVRDWLPIALMLVAYREMNWFAAAHGTHALERQWIVWDRSLLHTHGVQAVVESAGWLGPALLELSYLLVYGVGPFVVGILYAYRRRELVDRILLTYLLGTLLAYALFPYFPSDPPRTVFPGMDLPGVMTPLRRLNLAIVGGYGIHSSVFPSAHVSSAFSAAWGLLLLFKEKRWVGWAMLVYAASVTVATVYGRYHYAVDAIAGLAVSLPALLLALVLSRRGRRSRQC